MDRYRNFRLLTVSLLFFGIFLLFDICFSGNTNLSGAGKQNQKSQNEIAPVRDSAEPGIGNPFYVFLRNSAGSTDNLRDEVHMGVNRLCTLDHSFFINLSSTARKQLAVNPALTWLQFFRTASTSRGDTADLC